jgi:hypothetical protein
MIGLYSRKPRICLIKYCIEKEKRCCHLNYECGATMVSLITTIVAMVPMVAVLSLSVSIYKWEQLHIEAESLAQEYIFTCRKTVYEKTLITDYDNNNSIPKQQTKEMTKMLSACDKNMLYYKWRCELDSSKFFCSNSALDGYLTLRGIENTERPTVFTKA